MPVPLRRSNNLRRKTKLSWIVVRINLTRLAPQLRILDCGGKRSSTPLWDATGRAESGVAAALCHLNPNLCRPCAKLQVCITDKGKKRIDAN
jgi:hypothetical protein